MAKDFGDISTIKSFSLKIKNVEKLQNIIKEKNISASKFINDFIENYKIENIE